MSIQLSFILPCYNVDRYIADCLDSIFSQDIDESLYEVICVDDYSTDNTRDIIVSYCSSHPNLKLIEHKENLTAGGARNTGIENASGDYIWFVDPDDMIVPKCCSTLLSQANSLNADILMFNFSAINELGESHSVPNTFGDWPLCSGFEFVERYFPGNMSKLCIVWRCLFKSSFIKKNGLRYPQMKKSQDIVFLWNSLTKASFVASVSNSYYMYRSNPYSISCIAKTAEIIYSESIQQSIEIVKIIQQVRKPISRKILLDMENTVRWHLNNFADVLKLSQEERDKFRAMIKDALETIPMLKPFMTRRTRAYILMEKIGFGNIGIRFLK